MRSVGLAILFVVAGCRDTQPVEKNKPAPTITRVLPEEVTEKGYRLGTIEGEGFDTRAPVKVWFGSTPAARAAVVAKTKIQVEVPPGTHGSEVDVRVEIAGYEPATAPQKLRYISAQREHEAGDGDGHAGSAEPGAGSADSVPGSAEPGAGSADPAPGSAVPP